MTQLPWSEVALAKLSHVVGRAKAEEVFEATMRDLGLVELRSADDLYNFAQRVIKLDGFVGAVGALLSVHAVIHGATASSKDAP
jgi:hypothetical protein